MNGYGGLSEFYWIGDDEKGGAKKDTDDVIRYDKMIKKMGVVFSERE
ncbi:MAG: hypothetical protein Q4Q20_04920 [Methanocorpusculum sp.]|nr:hypothetical protein [Methanocorpusculum sp.]